MKDEIYKNLYTAVMFIPGFTDAELMYALSHMLDNKDQGLGLLEMNEDHSVLWLRTFLTKHYHF